MESSQTEDLSPRRSQKKIETSPYFALLKSNGNQNEAEGGEPAKLKGRQTLLSFTNGHLTTKIPFHNPVSREDSRRKALASVAEQTISLLPGLLATRPDAKADGFLCEKEKVSTLNPNFCPRLPPTKVRVIDSDTIDAAIGLYRQSSSKPVCVLNMANAQTAGGGFKHGSLAQEEALCYRSSLYFTLKHRHYPIPEEAAIYSPTVLIIRESLADGHGLLDVRLPGNLPVISVVSAAAICRPSLTKTLGGRLSYAASADRRLMEQKLRVILRTLIRNRHQKVVLGAFGCGAFGNPNQEVAEMWAEILQEAEFSGGWWEEVVFAVMDGKSGDNFTVFQKALDGILLK